MTLIGKRIHCLLMLAVLMAMFVGSITLSPILEIDEGWSALEATQDELKSKHVPSIQARK